MIDKDTLKKINAMPVEAKILFCIQVIDDLDETHIKYMKSLDKKIIKITKAIDKRFEEIDNEIKNCHDGIHDLALVGMANLDNKVVDLTKSKLLKRLSNK